MDQLSQVRLEVILGHGHLLDARLVKPEETALAPVEAELLAEHAAGLHGRLTVRGEQDAGALTDAIGIGHKFLLCVSRPLHCRLVAPRRTGHRRGFARKQASPCAAFFLRNTTPRSACPIKAGDAARTRRRARIPSASTASRGRRYPLQRPEDLT